jgi:GTP-binding protein
MRVVSAEYLKSALYAKDFPRDRRPEIAFAGRSNVGKSSLLNTLLQRKGLAKTSATPGKTQMINFFDVNGKFYFVDLPGYGYAKVPKTLKMAWQEHMTQYVTGREPLRLVCVLVDSRHEPTANDATMIALLDEAEVPTLIVATKIDKLSKSERKRNLDRIRKALDLEPDAFIVPFSSVDREGVKELWDVIGEQLA